MWRHGDAEADAVTDAVVDGDADSDRAADALASTEREVETERVRVTLFVLVTVTDADAQSVARAEADVDDVADRDTVPDPERDGDAVCDRETVPDVVKDDVGVMERVPNADGGRDGDCDGVPSCVVVRVPVRAPEVLGDTVPDGEPRIVGDVDAQRDTLFVTDGDGDAERDDAPERESVGVATLVGLRVCVLDGVGATVDEPLRDDVTVTDRVTDRAGDTVAVAHDEGDRVPAAVAESVVRAEGARVTMGVAVRAAVGENVAERVREPVPHADALVDPDRALVPESEGDAERE